MHISQTSGAFSKVDDRLTINSSASRGSGIGVMFLGFFGAWWMAIGCWGKYGPSVPVLSAVGAVAVLILFAGFSLARRNKREAERPDAIAEQARKRKIFRIVNLTQWAAIVALIFILNSVGHGQWVAPGIMLIVGVHFFPLAKLFGYGAHHVTGAALATLALTYPFLAAGGPGSPLGPLGAGLILWTSAVGMLLRVALRRKE
jgi:hypothetical protein